MESKIKHANEDTVGIIRTWRRPLESELKTQ